MAREVYHITLTVEQPRLQEAVTLLGQAFRGCPLRISREVYSGDLPVGVQPTESQLAALSVVRPELPAEPTPRRRPRRRTLGFPERVIMDLVKDGRVAKTDLLDELEKKGYTNAGSNVKALNSLVEEGRVQVYTADNTDYGHPFKVFYVEKIPDERA